MKLANLICLAMIALLPSTVWARGEQSPDAELLEFLGTYETSSGKAMDPLQFAEHNAAQQKKKDQPAVSKPDDRKQPMDFRKKPQKDQDHEK